MNKKSITIVEARPEIISISRIIPKIDECCDYVIGHTGQNYDYDWSDFEGWNNRIFKLSKFRSMQVGTPAVAMYLLSNPHVYLTPIGARQRKSSLDEFPQLWNILKGDMSFVGPRPALFNQQDLIELRTKTGVHALVPGLTGWAQINGRDELPIPQKVALDVEYMHRCSMAFDFYIIFMTAMKVIRRDGIVH